MEEKEYLVAMIAYDGNPDDHATTWQAIALKVKAEDQEAAAAAALVRQKKDNAIVLEIVTVTLVVKFRERGYLELGGNRCPACGSTEIEGGSWESDGKFAT